MLIYIFAPKLLRWNFFLQIFQLQFVRTKWCAHTFRPILGLFAVFDHNFANIVAPSRDKYENCVVHLKEQSPAKKTLKTSSKSGNKPQRNACSNYEPFERTVLRTPSVIHKQTNRKQTPYFRTYSRRALCDLPQTLHGDRARRVHHKRCH